MCLKERSDGFRYCKSNCGERSLWIRT